MKHEVTLRPYRGEGLILLIAKQSWSQMQSANETGISGVVDPKKINAGKSFD